MPKIEVNDNLFFNIIGTVYDYDNFEKKLNSVQDELEG